MKLSKKQKLIQLLTEVKSVVIRPKDVTLDEAMVRELV